MVLLSWWRGCALGVSACADGAVWGEFPEVANESFPRFKYGERVGCLAVVEGLAVEGGSAGGFGGGVLVVGGG